MNPKREARAAFFKQKLFNNESRFYNKRKWRDDVAPQQLRREPLCRICSLAGKYTPATEVDHVIPMREGGAPFDMLNLQSVCGAHHSMKTRAEQLGIEPSTRIKGASVSGMPIDPAHPWNK